MSTVLELRQVNWLCPLTNALLILKCQILASSCLWMFAVSHPSDIYPILLGQGPVAMLTVVWQHLAGILSTPHPCSHENWGAHSCVWGGQRVEWGNQFWNTRKCLLFRPWEIHLGLSQPTAMQFILNRVNELVKMISTKIGLFHKSWKWYLPSKRFLIENTNCIANKSA